MKRIFVIGMTVIAQAGRLTAQVPLDRADPTIILRNVPRPPPARPDPAADTPVAQTSPVGALPRVIVARAITVSGQHELPSALFADILAGFVGQELQRADLIRLTGAVADLARARGFPLASARIEPQGMANDILRVDLDLGQVDAVRVLGARNAKADQILQHVLVTGASLRQEQLERALGLVTDLAGVRVTASRFVRQDGFGILLVTIEQDRVSAYAQVDNRGSEEVGPIRSTLVTDFRGLALSADELAVVISQTPVKPSEFAFIRGRYSAPIGRTGTNLSVAGSFARSHPSGSLKSLNIIGKSADAAVAVQTPLLRRRATSVWGSAELRALGSDQFLAGRPLRRDRLVTLTGGLNGSAQIGGGQFRGELTATAGLPVAGTTREGELLASRIDGDARFVTVGYAFDWTKSLGKPFSVVFASVGQAASRPLLASAEIGLGGPGFGRAYDYAERTGDQGVLGSLELRLNSGRIAGTIIDRTQVFTFVDGGVVRNLRGGDGGGALASAGAGLRGGTIGFDWLVELGVPLSADRFDTGDRRPRVSFRLARAF